MWARGSWLIVALSFLLPVWLTSASDVEFCQSYRDCELSPVSALTPPRYCVPSGHAPSFWAWPLKQLRLRIQLSGQHDKDSSWERVGAPRVKVTRPSRTYCNMIGPIAESICEDCTEVRCQQFAKAVLGTRDYAVYVPAAGSCVYIEKLPDGVDRARVTWELDWDPTVCVLLVLGLVLLTAATPLSRNPLVHAAIGGIGSLVFLFVMFALWIAREMRGTMHGLGYIPFAPGIFGLGALLLALAPATRDIVLGWAAPRHSTDWLAFLSMHDPIYGLPIGWICLTAAVGFVFLAVSMGARASVAYFAALPDPDGEVEFTIGSDGRRIDAVPPEPFARKFLAFVLWIAGLVTLLNSTNSDVCSLLISTVAVLHGSIIHFIRCKLMAATAASPSSLRQLVSETQLKEISRQHTTQALRQLQQHVQSNPQLAALHNFTPMSELRLRRFSDCGMHVTQQPEFVETRQRTCLLL